MLTVKWISQSNSDYTKAETPTRGTKTSLSWQESVCGLKGYPSRAGNSHLNTWDRSRRILLLKMRMSYCWLTPNQVRKQDQMLRNGSWFIQQTGRTLSICRQCFGGIEICTDTAKELTHWKWPWCWEKLRAGGEGGNRGGDGWMASLTQWTWVWANSGVYWRTVKPGVLQFMGSRRVGHDGTTERQQPLAFREKGSRQVVIQKTEYPEG